MRERDRVRELTVPCKRGRFSKMVTKTGKAVKYTFFKILINELVNPHTFIKTGATFDNHWTFKKYLRKTDPSAPLSSGERQQANSACTRTVTSDLTCSNTSNVSILLWSRAYNLTFLWQPAGFVSLL